MDKTEVRLRCPLYETITLLLNHNELLDHVNLALGAHVFRLCSSTDIVVHVSKHSGLSQMWVELEHSLQQNTSIDPFIYCEVEQDLWCEECKDHPRRLKENTTGGSVTTGGYVKVQSAPYAYDQGAEAKGENPKRGPLLWFSYPQIRRVAWGGGIGCRILHLSIGQ